MKWLLAGMMALAFSLSSSLFGQGVTTSGIDGFVTDSAGKAVAGAKVTAVNVDTGTTATTTTGSNGQYRFSGLRTGGPYTMLLIFRLGRPDVFPVTDYGVRKGFLLTFGRAPKTRAVATADLPKPEAMHKRAKKWAPWRSVASWYLWRACDLEAAERKAAQGK